ncbi:MAG: CBS domain-containing protein [Spartobacteria bacterium]|nr:CBS domain-containing protein [Spartobacteria bacterium]
MRHRQKKRADAPGEYVGELLPEDLTPVPVVIVGAGTFLHDLTELVREYPEYEVVGVIDPCETLHGQEIDGVRVLGWLADMPPHVTTIIIGNAARINGFDRESIFRMLLRRHMLLPILTSFKSRVADDVILRRGTLVLSDAVIQQGASIGENCLLGAESCVHSGVAMPAHTVIMPTYVYSGKTTASDRAAASADIKPVLAREHDTLRTVINQINRANREIVLVVDECDALLGTVTDGDVRRGILVGIRMDQPVSMIMNQEPTVVRLGTSRQVMLEIMQRRSIRHLPVVDHDNRPVRLERLERIVEDMSGNGAIVMAGGLGSRLRPLTEDTPKPLLPVNGRPILDHILDGLKGSGINDVVISLNYLGEQIRSHVKDGRDHALNVNYVMERERLGTAGALSLIKPRPSQPLIVMNGDLLTHLNFSQLLRFQQEKQYNMVMCVKQHSVQIPYGVVDIREDQVAGLREKPVHEYFINAGIYVLMPSCLDLIPGNTYFDMTDLYEAVMASGGSVGAFPIYEYWRDIGRPEDLAAAAVDEEALLTDPLALLKEDHRGCVAKASSVNVM